MRLEVAIGLIAEVEEKIHSVKKSWIPDEVLPDVPDGSLMYEDPAAIFSWLPFLY